MKNATLPFPSSNGSTPIVQPAINTFQPTIFGASQVQYEQQSLGEEPYYMPVLIAKPEYSGLAVAPRSQSGGSNRSTAPNSVPQQFWEPDGEQRVEWENLSTVVMNMLSGDVNGCKGLSQRRAAMRMGVAPPDLSRWRRLKCSRAQHERIQGIIRKWVDEGKPDKSQSNAANGAGVAQMEISGSAISDAEKIPSIQQVSSKGEEGEAVLVVAKAASIAANETTK